MQCIKSPACLGLTPAPCSLTLRYGTGVEAAVAMLRQLPQLQSLDLQLTNNWMLFDEDSDGALWIGNGVWDWVHTPPLAGLPLRSLTVQGGVGLPPDWRQLASLQVLRVVSSPEFGQPWDDEDETGFLQWGSELASGLASLTRLEVKGILPGVGCDSVSSAPATHALPALVHGSRGCWLQRPVFGFSDLWFSRCCLGWPAKPFPLPTPHPLSAVEVVASMPALRIVRDIKGRQPEWRAALAAARPDVEIIAS